MKQAAEIDMAEEGQTNHPSVSAVDEWDGLFLLMEDVSWRTYCDILRGMRTRHVRVTYDERALEIMTLSLEHAGSGHLLSRLVEMLSWLLAIPIKGGKSTTFKIKGPRKGLEPDACYWIKNESRMRGKKKWQPGIDPPPDLAIEIDITHSSLNRMSIYAALKVLEVWRFDGKNLTFHRLDKKTKKYRIRKTSVAFPYLMSEKLSPFVTQADAVDETTWLTGFAEWVNVELLPVKEEARPRLRRERRAGY